MQDPQLIWDFGRWIARRESGSARLSWDGGELVLGVRQGRIHAAEGLDASGLADGLGCESAGEADLLAEARALAATHGIAETRAMGAAKEMVQTAIHAWMRDPGRELEIDDAEPAQADGATISITHALVELILADTEHNVAGSILPNHDVTLQRSGGFLELYAPLRLSEEADLIVAGITATASLESIARESSHHPDEVVRLVAALVATGVLEATEASVPVHDLEWPEADLDTGDAARRKIPAWMIGAAVAVVAIVIAIAAWMLLRGDDAQQEAVISGSGDWGVVVEMGCEPPDIQRMLRKRNVERKALRTIPADPTGGDSCFRLVWGSFPNREAAEEAMAEVPSGLIEEGFSPHVIEITEPESDGELGSEG